MRKLASLALASCLLSAASCLLSACGSDDAGAAAGAPPATGTVTAFDLGADLASPEHFFDAPYPSDLRLTADGTPDLRGMPHPSFLTTIDWLKAQAMQHPGFPVVPVAWFRFSAPLAAEEPSAVVSAEAGSTMLLVDVDPASSDRGALYPLVAATLPEDGWTPSNVLALAPRPGIVLHPGRRYAFVVRRELGDADGDPLGVPAALASLAAGTEPAGDTGGKALALYAPMWETLASLGIDAKDVAAATVFTTGDVVAETAALAEKLAAKYPVTLDDLHVDPDDGASHDRYCELVGTVTYPQFQTGTPPFDTEGTFDFSDGGLPAKQREETAPFTIAIPKGQMPAGGFPLTMFFHGSGGLSSAVVDRGKWRPVSDASVCPEGTTDTWNGVAGCNTKGEGPAWVLAPFGIAMAGSALPLNPQRLPGASETAYLNLNNLSAMRDTFRQGIVEQRMFLDALEKLSIDPATLGACTGVSLPPGATAYKLDASHVFAQGQSMGGMYTNLIGATDPRILAAVPTGAGGYWSHFILITPLIDGIAGKVGVALLGTTVKLSFLHPGLSLFETAAEAVDPMVSMPRLARRPLDGHPVRPIYEPVGQGDSYFPEATYDAMALAYGHEEAGEIVWPSMQEALKLEKRDGILPYPVKNDLESEAGAPYTGVVIQFHGDGVYDPHALYSQVDDVKYQYGCFLSTFFASGVATVPAPAPLGSACPAP